MNDGTVKNMTSAPPSGRAVASLVLGMLTFCTPLSFLVSIPAWGLGRVELDDIDAGLAPPAGRRCAYIGRLLGIIGTVLSSLVVLTLILLVVASK